MATSEKHEVEGPFSASSPLRTLIYPPMTRDREPYMSLLHDALESHHVAVDGWSARRSLRGRYDLVSLHFVDFRLYYRPWWRAAVLSAALVAGVAVQRLRGAAVVWTVHNLNPHELRYPRLAAVYWWCLGGLTTGFVSLSSSGVSAIETRHRRLAGKPHAVIPLGHYRDEYPRTIDRAEARRRLGIAPDASVISFCGQIRPYKGVPELLAAFARLDDPRAVLVVAGRPLDEAGADELRTLAAADPRVVLRLEFLPPDELQVVLGAADVVVAPFKRIFNSASALLALSFDRPILVPALGSMVDLHANVGEPWVQLYEGELTADHLRAALERTVGVEGVPPLDAHDWPELADRTAAFYRQLVASTSSHGWRGRAWRRRASSTSRR